MWSFFPLILAIHPWPYLRSILRLINVTLPNSNSILNTTALNARGGVTLRVMYSPFIGPVPVYENVPDYSAYGPMPDGRIKPDIVAPGVGWDKADSGG